MIALLAAQRERARQVLPPDVHAYFAGGAGNEAATREAEGAWGSLRLRPRVLRDVAAIDLSVDLPGVRLAVPLGVAPTASHTLAHPEGERATAAGTARAGALLVLSARSTVRLEDVARAAGPWWFQAYALRDRGVTLALAERAAAAGAGALVLTGDTPVLGARAGGRGVPLSDPRALVNLGQHLLPGVRADQAAEQDPSATEALVGELAGRTGLPVLVKGILRGDDAARVLAAGAAGVIVSNHGGRQVDRALSTAVALPEVAEAVDGRACVLVDGGIGSGADALCALALGAQAVLLGRPVLWALAAGGADGVADALRAVGDDLVRTAALVGAASRAQITRDLVHGFGDGGRPR